MYITVSRSLFLALTLAACAESPSDVDDALTLSMRETPQRVVAADSLNHDAIAVADLVNNTDAPQAWSIWSDDARLLAEEDGGVLEPGERQTLFVAVDARDLAPGRGGGGLIHVETDEETDSVEVEYETSLAPPPALCTFTVARDYITVTSGEMGADPALELDVDTRLVLGAGVVSKVSFTGTIKPSATFGADAVFGTHTVASGTAVHLDFGVEAVEHDPGSVDKGTAGGALDFHCTGSGSITDEEPVTLGLSAIAVGVTATW